MEIIGLIWTGVSCSCKTNDMHVTNYIIYAQFVFLDTFLYKHANFDNQISPKQA